MSEPFIGEIVLFAGNFAPRGWAFCWGQILSIAQNTALFSILGTTYGGNGQTTFGLPDLRGRTPVGQGQGPGLTNVSLGEVGGIEVVTLLTTNLPAHTHTVSIGTLALRAKNGAGNSQSPVNAVPATEAAGVTATYSTAAADANMAAGALAGAPTIGATGSNQPVFVRNPFLGLNYIIAIEGIFPSRN